MKKHLSLILTAAMLSAVLAGCGADGNKNSADSNDAGKTDTVGKTDTAGNEHNGEQSGENSADVSSDIMKVEIDEASGFPLTANQGYPKEDGEISVWHVWSSDYLESVNEVEIVPELEKRTGIKVDWTTVNIGERDEKFGIMLSSGDIPDLVYAQTSEYPGGVAQAVDDGVFMDITEFVDQYVPNYKALIESNEQIKKEVTSDDGRLLCFYQLACTEKGLEAEKEFLGLCIRQDWLDELGLDAPETIDEWYVTLKAFKEEKGVEAPLMIGPKGTLINGAFTSAFGVMPEFYQVDGKVKFGPAEDGYRDFVETFRQWYAEGLIDQNFMTNNVERFPAHEYTTTGMTGAFTHAYSMAGHGMQTQGLVTDDKFELTAVPNPVLEKGDTPEAIPLSAGIVLDPMYVSADCEDLEALGAWMNYMYSKEGAMLQGYGVEGIDYTLTDEGKVNYTDKILKNADGYTPSDAYGLTVANFRFGLANWYGAMLYNGEDKLEEYFATEDIWTNQDTSKYISSKITMTQEENEIYTTLYSDIQTFVDESIAQFIMGTRSMDEWDAFTQQLHDMGIDECIAAKQNALDRYNAR